MGSVAKKLEDSITMEWSTRVDGPLSVDFTRVSRTFSALFNVELWPCPACVSRFCIPAACPVGLELIGEHARTWLAMPYYLMGPLGIWVYERYVTDIAS